MKKKLEVKDLIKITIDFAISLYLSYLVYSSLSNLINTLTKLEKEYREKGEVEIADTYKEEIEEIKKKYLNVKK
jgi:hypothetical protein